MNMCKQLEQLHFEIWTGEIFNKKKVAARAFGLVPKLKLVVFWENMDVYDSDPIRVFPFRR